MKNNLDREEAELHRQIATLVEDASTPDRSQFIIRPAFPTWQEQLREREVEAHEQQTLILLQMAEEQKWQNWKDNFLK